MRPCNQCRQPVENSVLICDQCEQWNQSHPDESFKKVSRPESLLDNEPIIDADYSYAILMGAFSLVITALFALVGLLVEGFNGFMLGGAIGLIVGIVLFTVTIKL